MNPRVDYGARRSGPVMTRGATSLPGDRGSVNEEEAGPDRRSGLAAAGPGRPPRPPAGRHRWRRAAGPSAGGRCAPLRPPRAPRRPREGTQVARSGVGAPLALAPPPLAGQLLGGQQPDHGAAQRRRWSAARRRAPGPRSRTPPRAAARRPTGSRAIPRARRRPRCPRGAARPAAWIRPIGHQLVEVGLQHLAAQLDADRQVGGELQPRPRARGVASARAAGRPRGRRARTRRAARPGGSAARARGGRTGSASAGAVLVVRTDRPSRDADGTVNRMADLLGDPAATSARALRRRWSACSWRWLLWSATGRAAGVRHRRGARLRARPARHLPAATWLPRWGGVLHRLRRGGRARLGARRLRHRRRSRAGARLHQPPAGAGRRPSATCSKALTEWYRSLPLPAELRDALDGVDRRCGGAFEDAIRDILGPAVSAAAAHGRLRRRPGGHPGLALLRPARTVSGCPARSRRRCRKRWRPDARERARHPGRVGGRWVRGQLLLGVGDLRRRPSSA